MAVGIGTPAPVFELLDQHGRSVSSSALRGSRYALVFLPLAFSGVCGGELEELERSREMFDAASVRPIAVTVDSMFALRAWADAVGAGFSLLSDFWPHGEVARRFDAFDERSGRAERVSLLVDEDGVVRDEFRAPMREARPIARYREGLVRLGW